MRKTLINSAVVFAISFSQQAMAQEALNYQKPHPAILELADYQLPPTLSFDSKLNTILLSYRNPYKTLSDLNQAEVRLAGIRINPKNYSDATTRYLSNLKLRTAQAKEEIQVQGLPEQARIAHLRFSPNEKKIAFTHTSDSQVELWVIDVATAKAKKLASGLNATIGSPYIWYGDSEHILIKALPKNPPGLIDASKTLPAGPAVSNASGSSSQNRTYADLLKNKIDEDNFQNLIQAELHKVSLQGKSSLFKKADLYTQMAFSPDGNYLLLSSLQKPFSYIVPYQRFPAKTIVTDLQAKPIKLIEDKPLHEITPKGFSATVTGKRSIQWRDDQPASLSYVTALDEGDPAKVVEFRDEVFSWAAPFEQAAQSLLKLPLRYAGIAWGDAQHAVVYENWYETRKLRGLMLNPAQPQQAARLIYERNMQDVYADPGHFATKRNQYQQRVIAIEDNKAYLLGEGHSANGKFPFIDELNLADFSKQRLYQASDKNKLEEISSIEDIKKGKVLVRLQSRTDYPNYYFRYIKDGARLESITDFKNPFSSFANISKEVLKYQRKDGLDLSGTLYLPANYDKQKKEKLALLIWAYPEEFKDKNSAGQSKQNANEFTFPHYGSFVYWAARGYAVLDHASFPIVGEGKAEPNDSFIPQLIDDAEAAIEAVDKLGYIDKNRVAVGGHSYGAFMTANLLSHTKLFACGIARSGAYNRTLTPFGFQNEQRNFWDVPDLYNAMSPFMNAHKMKTPILLVHGEADNNPGTFTLQTERYFQALKGLGAPARMVILPKESHGYIAKENVLHLLWEQDQFLEKCLKKS